MWELETIFERNVKNLIYFQIVKNVIHKILYIEQVLKMPFTTMNRLYRVCVS